MRESGSRNQITVIYPYQKMDKIKVSGQEKEVLTCFLGEKQTLQVYTEDIFHLKDMDMIVCADNANGISDGFLAKRLQTLLGQKYVNAKKSKFNSKVVHGDVVICMGSRKGNFGFGVGWVAHAVLYKKGDHKNDDDKRRNVEGIFTKILTEAFQHNCTKIAMPSLESGKSDGFIVDVTSFICFSMYDTVNTYRVCYATAMKLRWP